MSFVHLHTHSEYSLLDGLGRIKKLVAETKRLGQPALALTDHGVMHGAIEFFRACKENEIKPIIGVEAYQTVWGRPMGGRDPEFDRENYHLLLLAKNMTGYRNLLKIASHSQINGYYYRPRVDHEFLAKHAEGLVATTGCLGAEVPNLLLQGKEKEAYERLGWYREVFGPENFFVELQEHSIEELRPINKVLAPWAEKFGLQLLATNDVHYVQEKDGTPHDVLLCVQTGALVSAQERMRLSDMSYFLKSREQMEATFRPFIDLPASTFDNSLLIADMCHVELEDKNYHLPDMPIPDGLTYETYLRRLTEEGVQQRYGANANNPDVQARKEWELQVIHQMGFDVYFLIVADLCRFARSRNIWYNVRGSGAGSLVAYATGITGIDPLKNNLIFERFLNPGRVTMPDFDLDFPDDQREQMIRYTIEQYGDDQVAQIATVNRMKARAAIRDVGRATGIELPQVDRIAKLIPAIPGKPVTIQDVLTEGHEFYNPELVELVKKEQWVQDLLETSMKLEGVARNSGIHAAAVIVADRDLMHYTPLMRASKGSVTSSVAQYEFPILESIGLLKVDFLGLSTLTVMREAARLIKERHGVEYTLSTIPFEGPPAVEAFKLLSSGEVSGVFQVESQGMRRVLTEMKPTSFEHIVATISLYRPGPLEYIPTFIRRMHGEEEVEYKHAMLEPIMAETYGICVYQEQIIQTLSQLAGYSPGEADLVRRAVSKKKASDIEKHKKGFVEGCKKNNIPEETATAIYADIEFFARYGFNKCLPGDTEVIDAATGRLIRIEDLYTGKERIENTITCDTDSLKLQNGRITTVISNGVKPVYRLTTALGRTIEATANHPFYTFAGWRLLEELSVDDLIAVPRCLPIEGQVEWPDHEVIVLGHLLAEGNLCHSHSVYFHSQEPAQCQDYVQAAEKFANVVCSITLHKGTYSIYAKRHDRLMAAGIVTWAKQMDIGGKNALNKEIPRAAFTLPNRQIGLLLSRMWEGDGHINVSGRSLYYATSSQRMARQVQHLLLRLGIISRLRTVTFPDKDGRIGYQIFVTGNEQIANFKTTVATHFVSAERQAQLEQLCVSEPASTGVKDVVPLAVKTLVRSAKEQYGATWEAIHQACGVAPREFYPTHTLTKVGFTRQSIQRLVDYCGSDELLRYGYNDIYWDCLVSIEYVGKKATYDLEVADTHNFVANDILVHNSHAADYAMITVQTAYLKAHYPVEYMAALLLVERDKTEKVTNFINECRRMGIEVLAPDVNYSGLDFEIQQKPADVQGQAQRDPTLGYSFPVPAGSAIRFGMAATKNVGESPVQTILQARRAGRPFQSLEDFCERVDLRKVGKRPLECLIKVGVFDRFGKRSQLLDVLDQLVAHSASLHDSRESGQLSMFDLLGAAGAAQAISIRLPNMEEVKGKEKLQWEKELLGVYADSHPMQQFGPGLRRVVTCTCAELDERHDGKNITLAGMILNVRTINTKKGDQMAFVQIEDTQGQCEVVVFPRTYSEVKDKLIPDTPLIFKGKAQTREGQTSLLLDGIQTYFDQPLVREEEQAPPYQKPLLDEWPTFNGMKLQETALAYSSKENLAHEEEEEEGNQGADLAAWAGEDEDDGDETTAPNQPAGPLNGAQPHPETPPMMQTRGGRVAAIDEINAQFAAAEAESSGWEEAPPPRLVQRKPHPTPAPVTQAASSVKPPRVTPSQPTSPPAPAVAVAKLAPALEASPLVTNGAQHTNGKPKGEESRTAAPAVASSITPNKEDDHPLEPVAASSPSAKPEASKPTTPLPEPNAPPSAPAEAASTSSHRPASSGRQLHITLRRSGNLERDKFRLKEIYDFLRDPRGRDQFFIRLELNGQVHQLAFPNDLCSVSERLLQELKKHFRVEVAVEG
jgi:DNA polymerase-3 subunit alpha